MTENGPIRWKCPDCHGEFDRRVHHWSWIDRCPWCGFKMEGLQQYDEEQRREEEQYREENYGLIRRFLYG